MSVDFIKGKTNSKHLSEARRQQRQISYLVESATQDDADYRYYQKIMCGVDYKSTDPFLNWVNAIFKAANFKSFYKYLRFPLTSSRLVKENLVPSLERVFFSEDSFFRYAIRGESVEEPEELKAEKFSKMIFKALLYRFNDILVHDLEDTNSPVRYLVSLESVIAIESHYSEIHRIAYSSQIQDPETNEAIYGVMYMDESSYIFYDKDYRIVGEWPHDLGRCPADYIASDPFSSDNDIVRDSVFSRVRTELEEFVFLSTLLKMTEPNGAIPIVTKFIEESEGEDEEETEVASPMSSAYLKGDKRKDDSTDQLQAGTVIELPAEKKDDGTLNTDLVEKFMHFHRVPTESLEYINKRIKEIEETITTTIIGDHKEQNREEAKNELQVTKSYDQKQDKLRRIAYQMTRIRKISDTKTLELKYGEGSVSVDVSYGTDFFIESQEDLYLMFEKAPNQIERSTILQRLAQNRGRFNRKRSERDQILYKLLPYPSDKDFSVAVANSLVDEIDMVKQLRLSYWISIFESTYGDLVEFWTIFEDQEESQTLKIVDDLLTQIITENARIPENKDGEEGESA